MIRRPLQFETAAGTYTWPRYQLEYDPTQPLILALVDLPGADYAFDQLGDRPAVRGVGTHTLRFLLVGEPAAIEAEIDSMRSICYLGARGRLVLEGDGGDRRSCAARITAMPQITLGVRDRQRAPVILTFVQLSDFQDDDAEVDVTTAITTDPQTVEITNPGDAVVYNPLITVEGPFDGLVLRNASLVVPGMSTPWTFATARVAVAGDTLTIDVGANRVEFSEGGGGAADDAANVTLQDGQVGLFAVAPGANEIEVEGAIGGAVQIEFRGTWV